MKEIGSVDGPISFFMRLKTVHAFNKQTAK